jgi:hypothetical protein
MNSDMTTPSGCNSANAPLMILEQTIENFHYYIQELIKALLDKYEGTRYADVFREQQLRYDMAITHNFDLGDKAAKKDRLVKGFYDQLKPHFTEIAKGNLKAISDVKFVKNFGLDQIIELDEDDTNDAITDYMKSLIQTATAWSIYKNIPSGLLTTIGKAAGSFAKDKKGDGPGEEINSADICALSKDLFSGANQDDFQKFAYNMMKDKDAMIDLCNFAASTMENDA